ncbi:MAG: radical SAM protein [Oscillospiraceae bacterium]|nr:radical SAM protein [Oscillospiraceae bacterium]
MGLRNKLAQYRQYKNGISHCTFNPEGPGVVRIHLVPPKFRLLRSSSYIVILNGYYLLPIGYSWALVLSYFMNEVNRFDGRPIEPADEETIVSATVRNVRKVYPCATEDEIREDLQELLRVLFAVARGNDPEIEIEKLSIRAYGKNMTAPHRMDLMVSAMTNAEGKWQCNQKCLFCYAAGQQLGAVKEMTTKQWKQAIDRLEAARVPMVTFTGGEPTLRPDIAELVGYAKRMVTRLNTNGVNLTPELVRQLKDAGLDSLQVTLYSHDEAVHNALVGSDHFRDTVRGIRTAVEAGLDISINTPMCRKNADFDKTLAFVHSLGVRFVTVSGLICTGMAHINHTEYDLTAEELCQIVRTAKAFCNDHEMEMDFTSPGLISAEVLEQLGMNVPMCGAALSNMAIAPDGTVVPCQSWLGADAGLGNILTDPFNKIWKHPAALRLRRMTQAQALTCPFRAKKGGDRS